jgi:hypothetical protein
VIYPPPPRAKSKPIDAGSTVRLLTGAYDLTGICEWSNGRRVRLLVEILGRTVPMTVPRESVEAA